MRIAYLTCVYPPYPGGIGMNAAGMAKEMAKRGHEVHVFTPRQGSGVRDRVSGVILHGMRPLIRWGNAAFIPSLLKELKGFDVIHLLYPFFGAAELLPLLRRRKGQKVVVHHMMDAVGEGWLGKFFLLYTQLIMPIIFRGAHTVLTLSEDYFRACDITYVYEQFEDAPPIAFIPNGVDTDLFCPRTEKKIPNPKSQIPTIVFVGGLDRAHYFKGIHVLVEALRMLKGRDIPFACKIIGEGNLRPEYEAHVREAGLTREIIFTGLIPHAELPAHYQSAAFCVVPSTSRVECFSITAAEAQACGIPALVSNFPGVRVTIQDRVTGFVVRPGDPDDLANKMELLLMDPARARQMGISGWQRVERLFSWKVIGDKLEEAYRQVKAL